MEYHLFGLQRSGTNYLEQLIKSNFHATRKDPRNNEWRNYWKHSIDIPNGFSKDKPTLIIYKNPYTWVESICLRRNVDWTRSQKTYPAKEGPEELRLGKESLNVENIAKTYKHFCNTWIWNKPQASKYIVIRYEDLLIENTREEILSEIQFPRKSDQWINPQRGKVSLSRDYDEQREQYYLSMKPTQLSNKHIDAINGVLQDDIIKLGYEYERTNSDII